MTRTALPAAMLAALLATAAPAGEPLDGPVAARGAEEFARHGAVCHGFEGRGDGPFAVMLTKQPTDLTKLAANNGGTFPFERTYRIIDGRVAVDGHGSPEMPVWGRQYSEMAAEEMREHVGPYDPELFIAGRILGLVMHLMTVQE